MQDIELIEQDNRQKQAEDKGENTSPLVIDFSRAGKAINRPSVQLARYHIENLETAKEVFRAVADKYLEHENNANNIRLLVNMIQTISVGTRAQEILAKRGISN